MRNSKIIEIELGTLLINIEYDAKGLSATFNLPKWRVRWALIKAGFKIMFS